MTDSDNFQKWRSQTRAEVAAATAAARGEARRGLKMSLVERIAVIQEHQSGANVCQ